MCRWAPCGQHTVRRMTDRVPRRAPVWALGIGLVWLCAVPHAAAAQAACDGGTRAARVEQVLSAIFAPAGACPDADQNRDGRISVADVVAAELAAPATPTATVGLPTPTPVAPTVSATVAATATRAASPTSSATAL